MFRTIAIFAAVVIVAPVVAAEPPQVVNRWAVLVGVDDYAYAQKLKYCGADQVALSKQLIAAGFPTDQVYLLHDKSDDPRQRPSQGNIERHVELVLNLADADDLVVIGFSGHGVHLGGKSYLCPSDGTLDDPKSLVSIDDLYEQLKGCAAQFKLVLVDACRNDPRPGGTRSMTATEGTRALARTLQELKLPEGVVLLNSCAPGEVSWEDEQFGHGVFMHYVLDGLRGAADTGNDGNVSLNELQAYAGQRTKAYVANQHRVAQRPFFKGDLTTEALEYALLPVPGGAKGKLDPRDTRFPPDPNVKPNQPWLGVSFDVVNEREVILFGALTDGPAGKAGLRADDTIYSVGGQKVGVNRDLVLKQVASKRPGDVLEFEIVRDGVRQIVPIVLEPIPPDGGTGRYFAAAEAGQTWAMNVVSRQLTAGDFPVNKDVPEAIRWYRRAIEAGDPWSAIDLAELYYRGEDVAKDDGEVFQLFEQALRLAQQKRRTGAVGAAAVPLGVVYSDGVGVAKNPAKAVEVWRLAAGDGNLDGYLKLGVAYGEGEGVAKDESKAVEYYHAAAKEGLSGAAYNLAIMIYFGRGVQQNHKVARDWFERAAEQGIPDAMYNLGVMFENGEGGTKSPVKAAEWYRKAADLGHVDAKSRLDGLQ
jgi:TPR repeat protein